MKRCMAALFAGCVLTVASIGAVAQAPIKIGTSMGLTGIYAEFGLAVQRGYQLCVKDANAKGGVLGRKLVLTIVDDKSDTAAAVAIYERLITQDKVDLVFSPYSTPMTDAVGTVTQQHSKPLVTCCAATSAIFRKNRPFLFMLLTPAERYLEGFIDLAAKRSMKTVLVLYEDTPFPKAIALGTVDFAKQRGLQVVALEGYPRNTKDFTALLAKFKAANADVIAAAGYYDDALAITRGLKELDVNPKMLAVTVGSAIPKFHETLGLSAEYIYGASPWEADLVTLRAGGLVPVARQYPGSREFFEAYRKEFPGEGMAYQTAQGYGACQVTLDAVRRAGAIDNEKIRDAIATRDTPTTFGGFKVDKDGVQIGHKMLMFQWQDGKRVIVWPEELTSVTARFPTPPWRKRP